jgi:hypothetical protein
MLSVSWVLEVCRLGAKQKTPREYARGLRVGDGP